MKWSKHLVFNCRFACITRCVCSREAKILVGHACDQTFWEFPFLNFRWEFSLIFPIIRGVLSTILASEQRAKLSITKILSSPKTKIVNKLRICNVFDYFTQHRNLFSQNLSLFGGNLPTTIAPSRISNSYALVD